MTGDERTKLRDKLTDSHTALGVYEDELVAELRELECKVRQLQTQLNNVRLARESLAAINTVMYSSHWDFKELEDA